MAKELETLEEREFEVLLTDISMPEMNGIALLKAALETNPSLVGIIMTSYDSVAPVWKQKGGCV